MSTKNVATKLPPLFKQILKLSRFSPYWLIVKFLTDFTVWFGMKFESGKVSQRLRYRKNLQDSIEWRTIFYHSPHKIFKKENIKRKILPTLNILFRSYADNAMQLSLNQR